MASLHPDHAISYSLGCLLQAEEDGCKIFQPFPAIVQLLRPSSHLCCVVYKKPMKEQQLIAGCKRGEAWAQQQLYELHAPVMMSVCMRYVNNRETAKDLLQDGFVKVYTKIHTYSGTGSFAGWMRRIFVTTALEYLRHKNALRFSVSIDECSDVPEQLDLSVMDQLCADDLLACIGQLPSGFRTVFNLFAIEGYTHAEIALMLRIKESTSRSQFIRARRVLQKNVQLLMMLENEKRTK